MTKENKEIVKTSKMQPSLLTIYADEVNDEKIFRSDCKMCNSNYRAEVEAKFEETNNMKAAFTVLKNKGEKDITYAAVRRHLLNHFVAQERKMMVKEYAKKINEFMRQKYNKRQQLLERVAMLQSKLYTIEVMAEEADLKDTMASADAMKKICDTILVIEKELDLIEKDLEPAKILVNNLKIIIGEEMSATQNAEVKNALMKVFEKLINSVKDIEIEI